MYNAIVFVVVFILFYACVATPSTLRVHVHFEISIKCHSTYVFHVRVQRCECVNGFTVDNLIPGLLFNKIVMSKISWEIKFVFSRILLENGLLYEVYICEIQRMTSLSSVCL